MKFEGQDINFEKGFEEYLEQHGVTPKDKLFIQVPISFIRNNNYKVMDKMLYMYLWTYSIKYKYAYPTQNTIAKDLKLTRKTVNMRLQDLENVGGIYIINRYKRNTKEKLPNLYHLADIDTKGNFDKDSLNILYKVFPNKIYYV